MPLSAVLGSIVPLVVLSVGFLGPVVAWRYRQFWRSATSQPDQPGTSQPDQLDQLGQNPRAATKATVAAVVGVVVLGGVGTVVMYVIASFGTIERPEEGIASGVQRFIWIEAWAPVAVTVAALVVARVRRRYTVTYVLALVSPLLPIGLWLASAAVIRAFALVANLVLTMEGMAEPAHGCS